MRKRLTIGALAAAAMAAKWPYVLGSKVLLVRVASELGWRLPDLAPHLIEWHRENRIRLARIDLVSAFPSTKPLERSWVADPSNAGAGWDAIDRDFFK